MSRSKKIVNPAAQKALDQLKVETAREIGLPDYQNTYKGALTSADNGRVGGQMVKKMIQSQQNNMSGSTAAQGASKQAGTMTSKYDVNQTP